jgi:hypothetical protein
VATMTVEPATDGDVFLTYLEHVHCPQLKPGHIVVMDNLGAQEMDGVKEPIGQTERPCPVCHPIRRTSISKCSGGEFHQAV